MPEINSLRDAQVALENTAGLLQHTARTYTTFGQVAKKYKVGIPSPRFRGPRTTPRPLPPKYGLDVNDFDSIEAYFEEIKRLDDIEEANFDESRRARIAAKWEGHTVDDLQNRLQEALEEARKEYPTLAAKVSTAAELAGFLGHPFAPDLERLSSRVSSVATMQKGFNVFHGEKFSLAAVTIADMLAKFDDTRDHEFSEGEGC